MKKCRVCAHEIKILIFKGGDSCSEFCRKILEEHPRLNIQWHGLKSSDFAPSKNGTKR